MLPDPIIKEVRKVRHEIESECGDDPQKFFEHIQQIQDKFRNRLVQRKPKPDLKVPGKKKTFDELGSELPSARIHRPILSAHVRRQRF
jgi:hypothetical protein